MTKQEALDFYKTTGALAVAAGVSASAVSQWETIPWDRQMRLEVVSKRKLRADPNPRLKEKVPA